MTTPPSSPGTVIPESPNAWDWDDHHRVGSLLQTPPQSPRTLPHQHSLATLSFVRPMSPPQSPASQPRELNEGAEDASSVPPADPFLAAPDAHSYFSLGLSRPSFQAAVESDDESLEYVTPLPSDDDDDDDPLVELRHPPVASTSTVTLPKRTFSRVGSGASTVSTASPTKKKAKRSEALSLETALDALSFLKTNPVRVLAPAALEIWDEDGNASMSESSKAGLKDLGVVDLEFTDDESDSDGSVRIFSKRVPHALPPPRPFFAAVPGIIVEEEDEEDWPAGGGSNDGEMGDRGGPESEVEPSPSWSLTEDLKKLVAKVDAQGFPTALSVYLKSPTSLTLAVGYHELGVQILHPEMYPRQHLVDYSTSCAEGSITSMELEMLPDSIDRTLDVITLAFSQVLLLGKVDGYRHQVDELAEVKEASSVVVKSPLVADTEPQVDEGFLNAQLPDDLLDFGVPDSLFTVGDEAQDSMFQKLHRPGGSTWWLWHRIDSNRGTRDILYTPTYFRKLHALYVAWIVAFLVEHGIPASTETVAPILRVAFSSGPGGYPLEDMLDVGFIPAEYALSELLIALAEGSVDTLFFPGYTCAHLGSLYLIAKGCDTLVQIRSKDVKSSRHRVATGVELTDALEKSASQLSAMTLPDTPTIGEFGNAFSLVVEFLNEHDSEHGTEPIDLVLGCLRQFISRTGMSVMKRLGCTDGDGRRWFLSDVIPGTTTLKRNAASADIALVEPVLPPTEDVKKKVARVTLVREQLAQTAKAVSFPLFFSATNCGPCGNDECQEVTYLIAGQCRRCYSCQSDNGFRWRKTFVRCFNCSRLVGHLAEDENGSFIVPRFVKMGGDPTRVCLPCNFFLERHGVLPPATWDAARCEAEDNCESKANHWSGAEKKAHVCATHNRRWITAGSFSLPDDECAIRNCTNSRGANEATRCNACALFRRDHPQAERLVPAPTDIISCCICNERIIIKFNAANGRPMYQSMPHTVTELPALGQCVCTRCRYRVVRARKGKPAVPRPLGDVRRAGF